MIKLSKKTVAYNSLVLAVIILGVLPLLTKYLNNIYSPVMRTCISELLLFLTYIMIAGKNIKSYNLSYLKTGIITGIFLSLADLSQKIGLLYTTPAKYAFLGNFSCITVPVLMYIFVKKKPSVTTILASIICMISAFVLNGISFSEGMWGIGELLCAISGLLHGVNIAGTNVYAKKFYVPLYLATQSAVAFIVSFVFSFVFNFTYITTSTGAKIPIERIMFSLKITDFVILILVAVIASALCWVLRTYATKHLDACVVAVVMPFSAVITSVLSVIVGSDTLNLNLVIGGILGLIAIFLSGIEDSNVKKKENISEE